MKTFLIIVTLLASMSGFSQTMKYKMMIGSSVAMANIHEKINYQRSTEIDGKIDENNENNSYTFKEVVITPSLSAGCFINDNLLLGIGMHKGQAIVNFHPFVRYYFTGNEKMNTNNKKTRFFLEERVLPNISFRNDRKNGSGSKNNHTNISNFLGFGVSHLLTNSLAVEFELYDNFQYNSSRSKVNDDFENQSKTISNSIHLMLSFKLYIGQKSDN